MALTDTFIRKLKPNGKAQKHLDGEGLYLFVSKTGKKIFKLRLRANGKDSDYTIGHYPAITLSKAREQRSLLKEQVRQGIDIVSKRKELKQQKQKQLQTEKHLKNRLTFSAAYDEFCNFKNTGHGNNAPAWSYDTLRKHNLRFNKHVLPELGSKPLEEITEVELESVLLAIQDKGVLDVLKKVRTVINELFGWSYGQRYKNGTRWIDRNVSKFITDEIFQSPKSINFKHIDEPKGIADLLPKLHSLRATFEVKTAILLAFNIFARPINVSNLRWEQVDFENKLIRYSAEDMKMDQGFLIPMSNQVIQLLESIEPITGHSDFVFLSPNGKGQNKPISRDSLGNALRRNGIHNVTPHGFRHTASTALNNLDFDAEVIELSLAHVIGGTRGIYNKSKKLEQRKVLMQAWSDYLENLTKEDKF